MSKDLIIAEKPSVAKDIARALGGFADHKEYLESEERVITWAVGHLVEFISPEEIDPKYKAWQLEDLPILPKEFVLKAKEKCGARLKVINSPSRPASQGCRLSSQRLRCGARGRVDLPGVGRFF